MVQQSALPMTEEVIEPDLPICDPHHHLWDMPEGGISEFLKGVPYPRYLLPELLSDLGQGHNITETVFVEARAFYRADGPEDMMPLGETEFVNGVAAMSASGRYGDTRICAGIVGRADLMAGAALDSLLEAHRRAAGDRFKGIRQAASEDPTGSVTASSARPLRNLYLRPDFREGFARLQEHGLTFDAWLYHPQITDLTDLARAFPEQPIVLDHLGTPIGIGTYAGQRDEIFAQWQADLKELASCPNVSVKLGGLGMFMLGFETGDHRRVTSQQLADAWRPYVEAGIEAFGPARCMFESNFPVDAFTCGYGVLWNAFKRIATGASADEKALLFRDTARSFYGLA